MISAVAYYALLHLAGAYSEEYGTFIWNFTVGGSGVSLWQEYALFFSLPMSLAGFVLGNLIGRSEHRAPGAGAAA
jgi:hypothetical protein